MRCPQCNAKNDDGVSFCSLCGEVFQDVSSSPAPASKELSVEEGSAAIPGLYQTADQLNTKKAKPTASAIMGFIVLMVIFAGLSLLSLVGNPIGPSLNLDFGSGAKQSREAGSLYRQYSWRTDYVMAKRISTYYERPILILFTSSDSPGACEQFESKILTDPEFYSWASPKVVLLKIDSSVKTPQNPIQIEQARLLAQQYKISELPVMVFAGNTGKEFSRLEGYTPTTTQEWIAKAETKLKAWKKPFKRVGGNKPTRRSYRRR